VSSPRFPFTTSTSTPGSFRNASAKLAAYSRVPAQVGHSRMVIFFITGLPPIRMRLHPRGRLLCSGFQDGRRLWWS
jgi:hypothetical protein